MQLLPPTLRGARVFGSGARLVLSALALGVLGAAATPAHADVKYTSVMSIVQGGDDFKPMTSTTTWLKDGVERIDTKQEFGPMKMEETTITSATKKNRVYINPTNKTYTVDPFGANGRPVFHAPVVPGMTGKKPAKTGPAGTGKIVMTINAKLIGIEKMLDYQARHTVTNTSMDMSGCCGTGTTAFKIEEWRADIKLPTLAYPHDPSDSYGGMGDGGNDCKITFETKGTPVDQKGLALKTIMFDPKTGKPITQTQITMLSFAALSDDPFAIPAGYKELSHDEYDKQKQKAMMDAIMKGAGGGAGAGGDDDADKNTEGDKNTDNSNDGGTMVPGADAKPDNGGNTAPATPDQGDDAKPKKKKKKNPFGLPF